MARWSRTSSALSREPFGGVDTADRQTPQAEVPARGRRSFIPDHLRTRLEQDADCGGAGLPRETSGRGRARRGWQVDIRVSARCADGTARGPSRSPLLEAGLGRDGGSRMAAGPVRVVRWRSMDCGRKLRRILRCEVRTCRHRGRHCSTSACLPGGGASSLGTKPRAGSTSRRLSRAITGGLLPLDLELRARQPSSPRRRTGATSPPRCRRAAHSRWDARLRRTGQPRLIRLASPCRARTTPSVPPNAWRHRRWGSALEVPGRGTR